MNIRTVFTACVMLAASAIASCGTNGADAHGGYHALGQSAGARSWTVWYLDPPWVLDMQMPTHMTLHVPAFYNPGTVPALMHGSMALTVDFTSEPVASALATRAAQAMIPGDGVITAPRAVMFANAMGTETVIGGPEHEVRIAAVAFPDGQSLVLAFEATTPLSNDADVTTMIGLVETM